MRYLGIDFGLKRVGLAISEGELASPYQTLQVKNFHDALKQVTKLIEKENFEKVIVGLPEGKMGQTVLGFIKALRKRGIEAEEADETLSSKKALEQMIEANVSRNSRRLTDDKAATIILQDYLDSHS